MFRLLQLIAGVIGVLGLIITAVVALVPGDRTPSSAWIVFQSNRDGDAEIYRMRVDGSNQQNINRLPNYLVQMWLEYDISVFNFWDGNYERIEAEIDQQNILEGKFFTSYQLSANGEWIVLAAYWEGNPDIYRIKTDGTGKQNLTNGSGLNDLPAWSPDGQWIAFTTDRDGPSEVYRMKADGSQQQRLTVNAGVIGQPKWSPDGKWIVFDDDDEIYRMRADGSQLQNLTNSPASDWNPQWSPDGQWIAFETTRDGNREIYAMRADGSHQRNLTHNPAGEWSPRWSVPLPLHRSWHPWRMIAGCGMLLAAAVVPYSKIHRLFTGEN